MNHILPRMRHLPVLILLSVLAAPTAAQDPPFRHIELKYGISLEIPSHWTVVPQEVRKKLEPTEKRITEKAGIESSGGKTEGLLAVDAAPSPAGAMIRVNVTSPARFSEATLAASGPNEMKALRSDLAAMFQKLEASGGPRILELEVPRIERLNGHQVLVIPYRRAGAKGAAPWEVTQYKIPVADRLVELTLSHRQPEAPVWAPLLARVRSSLRF